MSGPNDPLSQNPRAAICLKKLAGGLLARLIHTMLNLSIYSRVARRRTKAGHWVLFQFATHLNPISAPALFLLFRKLEMRTKFRSRNPIMLSTLVHAGDPRWGWTICQDSVTPRPGRLALIRKIDLWESSFENLYSYFQKCEPHVYEFIFLMSLHDIWWNCCECYATMTGFQRRGAVTKSCQHQCSPLCRRLYVHN